MEKKLEKLREKLNEQIIKEFNTVKDKQTNKYIKRLEGGAVALTDNIDEAIIEKKAINRLKNSPKYLSKLGVELVDVKITRLVDKFLPYDEKIKIREEIRALESGFDNVEEYQIKKQIIEREKADELEKKIKASFFWKKGRKGKSVYFRDIDDIFFNANSAIELFVRYAKKLGAKRGFSSKSGSVYLDFNGFELRVSDHELPNTAVREYNQFIGGTRWNDEIIFTDNFIKKELINIKNQKDFETWVLSKFDDNGRRSSIEQIEEMALDELLKERKELKEITHLKNADLSNATLDEYFKLASAEDKSVIDNIRNSKYANEFERLMNKERLFSELANDNEKKAREKLVKIVTYNAIGTLRSSNKDKIYDTAVRILCHSKTFELGEKNLKLDECYQRQRVEESVKKCILEYLECGKKQSDGKSSNKTQNNDLTLDR